MDFLTVQSSAYGITARGYISAVTCVLDLVGTTHAACDLPHACGSRICSCDKRAHRGPLHAAAAAAASPFLKAFNFERDDGLVLWGLRRATAAIACCCMVAQLQVCNVQARWQPGSLAKM